MNRLKQISFHKALKILWLGVLSASILSNPMLAYPGRDSGIFLYIGSLILKGKIPYVDAWENKGPLVFYINALGLWLTDGSRWGIWLLEFLFIFVSGYFAYRILKELLGEIPALVGTSVFIVTAGNVLQGGNFSEEYSLLFSSIALFFFISSLSLLDHRLDEVIIGATLGFNILLRPNNISVQIAIAGTYFLLAVFSKEWKLLFQRAIQIAAGMLAVLIPVILYFYANDALTEMVNVVIVFNSQYSTGGGMSRILEGIVNAANGIGLLWVGIAAVGYVLAVAYLLKWRNLNSPEGGLLFVLLLGLPIEAILSTVSGKNYPHYFIGWSLYIGLLAGFVTYLLLVIFTILTEEKNWAKTDNFVTPLIVFLLIVTLTIHNEVWKNYAAALSSRAMNHAPLDYRDPVADYIEQNTAPEDKILVWGFRPIINFTAQRKAPATYLPYPLSHVDTPLAHRWADEFFAQIQADPPALIINMIEEADRERIPDLDSEVRKGQKIKWKDVVLAHNYKDVLAFIGQNYIKTDTVNGSDIYRLKNATR